MIPPRRGQFVFNLKSIFSTNIKKFRFVSLPCHLHLLIENTVENKKFGRLMANKKPNTSRLFQLALKDVLKSNAGKLERNSQCISTREKTPLTMEPNHGIPSIQKGYLVDQRDLVSSLPSKDLNKCQKISHAATDDTADTYPVSLSIIGSNNSLVNENPFSLQDDSTSIYSLPISVFEQSDSQTKTDSINSKWIDPPSYNLSNFCNSEELSKLHGDQSGCDLFPELLSDEICGAHLSKESRTVELPLTNELGDIRSVIPAPKSADHFFNSSSYTDRINALSSKEVLTNLNCCDILSDSLLFSDQNARTAISSPKPCDNFSYFPFSDVGSSTDREVSLPAPNYYEHLSNSETFHNHENSQHSIPTPKSLNFFNSFSPRDELCLPNSEQTIPSPKSYSSFDSSVSLSGKVCSSNCDMMVSAKQLKKCNKELNSDFFENQIITSGSKFSTLKWDMLAEYSEESNPMSCSSDNCHCNVPSCSFYTSGSKPSENFFQRSPNLRDFKNELEKPVACDNVFPNDYLDELIKLGSKECDIYRNEADLGDIFTNNAKPLNKRNYEPLHTFDLENHNLKPSTYTCVENRRLVDFDETSTSRRSVLELNDASMPKLDFDFSINQSNVSSNIPHSQTHLDQSCITPFNYCNSESKNTVPPFLDHFDELRVDSIANHMNELTASETKSTDNSMTSDCFVDKADSMKDTNSLLFFNDQVNGYSASRCTTSLDSLVDSNFENVPDIVVNISDNVSVNSYRPTSTSSINEILIASKQNCVSLVPGVFCNESKSKSLLECNRLIESSAGVSSFFSKPSTSIDSGVGFLLNDNTSNASLDKSSTCSELETDVFPNFPEKKSSKLLCHDMGLINAFQDCQDKKSATATELSENDGIDFFVEDQQRIDNLIDQFLKM